MVKLGSRLFVFRPVAYYFLNQQDQKAPVEVREPGDYFSRETKGTIVNRTNDLSVAKCTSLALHSQQCLKWHKWVNLIAKISDRNETKRNIIDSIVHKIFE